MKALWDWAILDGCFGTSNIHPTDMDGLVERKGKFLLIETKSPNKAVPEGQAIMFNHLLKTGVFTIIVVWGETDKPEYLLVWGSKRQKTDLQGFRAEVIKWYNEIDI